MPKTSVTDKLRVVIVGGGCAGLTAAWELAKLPDCEVHLYERSWRLGGKGASGRDEQGRIREHGLHVWLGFYENAFRLMRECYAEVEARNWGPHADQAQNRLPHGSIDDAFFPEPHVGVAGRSRAGEWEVWSGDLPPMKGRPGDPIDVESNPFTLASYLARCLHLLNALMLSIIDVPGGRIPGEPRPDGRSASDEARELDLSVDAAGSPRVLVERMARMLRGGLLTTAAGVLQGVTILEDWLRTLKLGQPVADTVFEFVEALATQTRKLLRDLVAVDEHIRRKTEIIDIVITIAVGLYRDRVLFDERGLDTINNIDYRDWLMKHGATRTSVNSPFMEGIYDLVFAYRDGDHDRPALAAGVALRGALRMFFTYRGAMFYRMRSGMGETIFSPLYKVLAEGAEDDERQVTFHFLHALDRVAFDFDSDAGPRVASLDFSVGGDRREIDEISRHGALDHFGCWPHDARLFASAVREQAAETLRLKADEDFDVVVFALGIDDFVEVCENKDRPEVCPFQKIARWDAMRKHVKTVATKAAQVWMSRDLQALGWYRGAGLISAMGDPFATWADMTHTLAGERAWRSTKPGGSDAVDVTEDGVRSVAAFCSVLSEQEVEANGSAEALANVVGEQLHAWLSGGMRPFWPRAFQDEKHTTALDDLVPPLPDSAGQGEVPGHHVQVNAVGSERYTLALPGSSEHRVSPLDRSVVNMTLAGDWTACGLDAGCVEAAVMSGMLAVYAITGDSPPLDAIVGYHHP